MFTPKLGKLPRRVDFRTIQLETILNIPVLPPVPESFDIDKSLNAMIAESPLGNDSWGDCVITGRANMTWRFEYFSQKKQIPITTDDCLNEYWAEQGVSLKWAWLLKLLGWLRVMPDNGLVMLNSLNAWRRNGWTLGGKNYTIYAYAEVPVGNNSVAPDDPIVAQIVAKRDIMLKQCIQLLNGAYVGFAVPQSAIDQFNKGQIWTLDKTSKLVGGHCVWMGGFDPVGPYCYTWGKKQQMTWQFWHWYCEEAYGVIDNVDNWLPSDPINVPLLQQILKAITG